MALDLLIAAGVPTSIEGVFLQYGLIGAIALALGVYARSAIKNTEDRAQRLEDDNRRLYGIMAEQMVPALTKATEAVADATTIMSEIRNNEDRTQRLEDDNRRLYGIMAEQMVPALTKATEAIADATTIMSAIRKQAEINAAVEAARRLRDE